MKNIRLTLHNTIRYNMRNNIKDDIFENINYFIIYQVSNNISGFANDVFITIGGNTKMFIRPSNKTIIVP